MGDYKEHKIFNTLRRKGIIITYLVLIVVVFIVAIFLLAKSTTKKEIQDVVYTEDGKIDYKVFLKENEFFEENYLAADNQYISSLIDYVQASFRYTLSSPEKNVDYKYTYGVVAKIEVKDSKTQNMLYDIEEVLIENKEHSGNTNVNLVIDQPIRIDYNKYNDIIKKFVDIYDLSDFSANLTVKMNVNIIENENDKTSAPAMTLKIPLTTKTIAIDLESKAVNQSNQNVKPTTDSRGYIFGAILLIFADLIIIKKMRTFMKDTESEEAVYNAKLRKIMVSYGSYVQKLNSEFDFTGYQIIGIDLFEDLLQIRETIDKPILMIEKESSMETYFFIPTDKTVYLYELKKGTVINNKEEGYKAKEEQKDDNK